MDQLKWLGGTLDNNLKWSVLMFGLDADVAYVVAIAKGGGSSGCLDT